MVANVGCASVAGEKQCANLQIAAIETENCKCVPDDVEAMTDSGRAWKIGTHQHMLDPDDPWLEGYRLSDTWGV